MGILACFRPQAVDQGSGGTPVAESVGEFSFRPSEETQAALRPPPVRKGQRLPVLGPESIMSAKAGGGSTEAPVQAELRWGCDTKLADRISRQNRRFAERPGYWSYSTTFLSEARAKTGEPTTFYDSVTGQPLFTAPLGRTLEEFVAESKHHGWPSFRDQEVHWDNVRCLKGGEAVSLAGTHLGHNLPDKKGNRYCINLVSIAGQPSVSQQAKEKAAPEKAPASTPPEPTKTSYKKHKELGNVHWIRDLDEGLAIAKATGKPVFCLFQEIPGCQTCTTFGSAVLSHADIVASIEGDFVPVAIFNNVRGKDMDVLRRYSEPSWNNPVVRFLDSEGEDILPRRDNIWDRQAMAGRMVKALKASGKPLSKSLQDAARH